MERTHALDDHDPSAAHRSLGHEVRLRAQSKDAKRAVSPRTSGSTTSRAMPLDVEPSPVQNSSVATHCAPGIIPASVVFPAQP